MSTLRAAVSAPTAVFGLGLVAFSAGLWELAPWVALVVVGAGAMAGAVLAAMPRREA